MRRAPSAVLIPISRLRPRTMYEHAVDADRREQQRHCRKGSQQQRAEALRRQLLIAHLHHRPDTFDGLLWIDRADRRDGRLCERGGRHGRPDGERRLAIRRTRLEIHGGRRAFGEAPLLDVADDSDDAPEHIL